MKSAFINATNCITPLGLDSSTNFECLMDEKSGISLHRYSNQGTFYAGKINSEIIENEIYKLFLADDYTFLEKISILALKPIVENMNAYDLHNCGFVVATTKGNIENIEGSDVEGAKLSAYAKKIAAYFGILSEPIVVSNACVSGIYAVEVAKRLIVSGMYDNVLVLATDVVSPFVISGFQSFQAISAEPCRPFSNDRSGVTLGEAAAAVLISPEKAKNSVEILGHGSVNDANHISGPSRTGEGLYQSVSKAFAEAKIDPKEIGFISAHGTATTFNDEMESIAFKRVGLGETPIHSLKGYYGHTLGASGLLETIMSIESIQQGKLIVSKNFTEQGTTEKLNVTVKSENFNSDYFLKTASGFGGFNTAIIFKKLLETSKYKILDHCSISQGIVSVNDEIILRSETSNFKEFAKEIYNNLNVDYPKFFKMDNLSKLAFLGAEILSQNNPIAKDTAVILSNSSSSLDTDIKHDVAIRDSESYHPSPAVFVYTLPNICLGEISIRHELHTENSFFIFDRFNPEFLEPYVEILLESYVASEVICGWTEIFGNDYSAFLYRVSAKGNVEHSIKNLQNLYNKWNH